MRFIELKKSVTVLFLLLTGYHSFTQTVTWDSTFNGNGHVPVGSFFTMTSLLVQPDSNILVTGQHYAVAGYDVAIARYKVNGSADSSFGNNGVVFKKFCTVCYNESAQLIALLPNGKILLLCKLNAFINGDTSFYIMARLFPNGNIDSSFGQDGIADLNFSKGQEIDAMSIQRNGKIVLGGSNDGTDGMFRGFIIARLNTDGSYDNSFGTRGLVHTVFTHHENDTLNSWYYDDFHEVSGIVMQDDEKIIAAGYTFTYLNGYRQDTIAIARYNTNGSLDSSYDDDGKIFFNPPNKHVDYDYGSSVTTVFLQPDQKLLIVGNFSSTQSHGRWTRLGLALIRLNTNGQPDSSFDGDGMRDYGGSGHYKQACVGLALQSDHKILVGFIESDPDDQSPDHAIMRVNSNGENDNDFGPGGVIRPLPWSQYNNKSLMWSVKIKGNRIYMLRDSGRLAALKNNGIGLDPATRKLCQSDANLVIKAGLPGTSYQWQLSLDSLNFNNISNNNNYSGVNTSSLSLNNIGPLWHGYRYRCITNNSTSNTTTIHYLKNSQHEWIGAVSNQWENPANWLCGTLPGNNSVVLINSAAVVIHSNVTIGDFRLTQGATVTVDTGYNLTITQNNNH